MKNVYDEVDDNLAIGDYRVHEKRIILGFKASLDVQDDSQGNVYRPPLWADKAMHISISDYADDYSDDTQLEKLRAGI